MYNPREMNRLEGILQLLLPVTFFIGLILYMRFQVYMFRENRKDFEEYKRQRRIKRETKDKINELQP